MPPFLDYLETYAESEAHSDILRRACLEKKRGWQEVVVVPLCEEHALVPDLLESLSAAAAATSRLALAVLVINGREDGPPATHETNARLLAELAGRGDGPLLSHSPHLDLLVIDRASPGHRFPPRQGVGLARKIGCDLAIRLIAEGLVQNEVLHTTDADARVAEDYFTLVPKSPPRGLGAVLRAVWTHPFRHVTRANELDEPHRLYELSLHYYVAGLAAAGSPYAFHTIGSTLSFRADAYAMVRGFPRREAAEDFYLLNKLAKVGQVQEGGGEVRLIARASHRVPFGTGRGTARIARLVEGGGEFTVYHPDSFHYLKLWLDAMNAFAEHRDLAALRAQVAQERLLGVLEALGAMDAMKVAAATRNRQSALLLHAHVWFDAFRTLRFVHLCRDRFLPPVSWRLAISY